MGGIRQHTHPLAERIWDMQVFAFLNLEHPAVAWAVMRGMVVSADRTYQQPHPGFISFMLAGMIEWAPNFNF